MRDELQEMLAKDQIRDLTARLARAMDQNDGPALLTCYHPGATDHHGEFDGPVEEFVGYNDLLHRTRVATMYHLLGSHLITVDGSSAHGELHVVVFMRSRGDVPVDITVGGRYLDRYDRRASEWRLTERRVLVDWRRSAPVG